MAKVTEFNALFICAKPYSFTSDDGNLYEGVNVFCLDEDKTIIKARAVTDSYKSLTMGDVIAVGMNIFGDRVKYEV